MNYYKHHLGDYDGATAHLSWDEDMAYTRLLRAYYRREGPIPTAEAYRLVRASSKAQRAAVDSVLSEFFQQTEDGWHNKRADEEIAEYHESEDGRIAKQENEKERQRRHRARRKELFAELRRHDLIPAWDTPIETLENMCRSRSGHAPVTRSATATQEPEPITKNQRKKSARARATPIPEGFQISERVKTWAQQKGFSNLEAYLEFFIGRMRANGKTYTDWDEALMNCIREDWPELRKGNGATPPASGCARCHGAVDGGWTMYQGDKLCNQCWERRYERNVAI